MPTGCAYYQIGLWWLVLEINPVQARHGCTSLENQYLWKGNVLQFRKGEQNFQKNEANKNSGSKSDMPSKYSRMLLQKVYE